ncbi:MAG: ribonuclease H-like domain-containing protein [Dehalococcoidia bacterium]
MLRAETRERLRLLIREIETRPRAAAPASMEREPEAVPARPWEGGDDLEVPQRGLREAVRRETDEGTFTYRELRYDLDYAVGGQSLSELEALAGAIGVLAPDAGAEGAELESLLFLDIETTGLGGAGAIAFLVATGRVEGGAFVLRQYLAESPAEEGALLDALIADTEVERGEPVLATYNGRAFDAPMLDARATMHRRRAGFESLRHVDLLMPARAVYRGWLASCRLATIESEVMGLTRPSADVDGAEVPAWYFRYLRTGDMRCIEPIASHNAIDVVSLAALAGRLGALVGGRRAPEGGESLGLARLLGAAADLESSKRWLERAAAELGPGDARREALMRLGLHYRRAGRHDLAEPLWWELVSTPGLWSLHAHEELAKYYEHRCHDFARASDVVEQALALATRAEPRFAHARHIEAFRYRLARLTSRQKRASGTGSD